MDAERLMDPAEVFTMVPMWLRRDGKLWRDD